MNGPISLEGIKSTEQNKQANSARILITDSDDELPQESVTPLEKRVKKLKATEEVIVVDDDDHELLPFPKFTHGSVPIFANNDALRDSSSDDVKSGNCSSYDEVDSTDNDNGTALYGDAEEEELWRQMAFAHESSKVTVEYSQGIDLKPLEDCDHSFMYKDDTGEVCRVCGLIKTPIESMIEVVFNKTSICCERQRTKGRSSNLLLERRQSS